MQRRSSVIELTEPCVNGARLSLGIAVVGTKAEVTHALCSEV